jgi:hypothetical protein
MELSEWLDRVESDVKRLKLVPNKLCRSLVLNILMVALGIRDAFMLDQLSTTPDTMARILCAIFNDSASSKSLLIVALESGDIIIARKDAVLAKWENRSNPVIVNVSSRDNPSIIGPEESNGLFSLLRESCSALLDACASSTTYQIVSISPDSRVGLVFFAGWILGYACIYHFALPESGSIGCAALAMQELRKVTVSAVFPSLNIRQPVQEFTIPECVLSTLDFSREMFEEKLKIEVDIKRDLFTKNYDDIYGSEVAKLLFEISYDLFTLPHIML